MKAKVYCNKQDCAIRKTFIGDTDEYSRNLCCNADCDLAKEDSPHPSATICGWVARDQPNSFTKKGALHVFHHKPSRDFFDDNDVICGFWDEDSSTLLPLAETLFPSLTWQDEPLEVEITIKPKKG